MEVMGHLNPWLLYSQRKSVVVQLNRGLHGHGIEKIFFPLQESNQPPDVCSLVTLQTMLF
jgi:hypothetical protein